MQDETGHPLVAVTGPHRPLKFGWWATRFMLWLCGLRAVYITARTTPPSEPIHGIIIGGGSDIEPHHYGGDHHPSRQYDMERDEFEMAMIQRALKENIPVLGICRGAQLINVVSKGSLHQDIRPLRKATPNKRRIRPIKWVELQPNSRVAEAMQTRKVKVNSLHEQAIDQIGQGLSVVGRDKDGFVQAIESNYGFLIGVQWHPEYLPYQKQQRKLFSLFARAVRKTHRELSLSQSP